MIAPYSRRHELGSCGGDKQSIPVAPTMQIATSLAGCIRVLLVRGRVKDDRYAPQSIPIVPPSRQSDNFSSGGSEASNA